MFDEERPYLGIVGSRDYQNLEHIDRVLDMCSDEVCVVTGDAKGVDTYAFHTAKKRGNIPIRVTACWDAHGKGAGMRRNPVIVDLSTIVFAFWDGKSKGTFNSIVHTYSTGKNCYVVNDNPSFSFQLVDQPFLEERGWTP